MKHLTWMYATPDSTPLSHITPKQEEDLELKIKELEVRLLKIHKISIKPLDVSLNNITKSEASLIATPESATDKEIRKHCSTRTARFMLLFGSPTT